MKISTASVGVAGATPFFAWIYSVASQAPTEPETLVPGLSSISAMGIVYYFVAHRDPKREKELSEERERHATRMEERDKIYRADMKEIAQMLGTKIEASSAVIKELTDELRSARNAASG